MTDIVEGRENFTVSLSGLTGNDNWGPLTHIEHCNGNNHR